MTWKPQSWRDVWPGQDWMMPDGDVVHVGAVMSDGTERHALCTLSDGGCLHIPATVLFDMATFKKDRYR